MSSSQLWKDRLYQAYVSSGQVSTAHTSAATFFNPRASYLNRLIDRCFPGDHQARVLDLGCGHGAFLYFLKRAGYGNITGIDASVEQIEQAHCLGIPEAQHGQMTEFLDQTNSKSTDAVVMIDILEHLAPDDLLRTLDSVFRILKPGGRCIIHVPNGEGIYSGRVRYGDLTHERSFTPQSLRQALRFAGFSSVDTYEEKPCVHNLMSALRRVVWELGTLPHRILLMAETGEMHFVLSQNLLAVAHKGR